MFHNTLDHSDLSALWGLIGPGIWSWTYRSQFVPWQGCDSTPYHRCTLYSLSTSRHMVWLHPWCWGCTELFIVMGKSICFGESPAGIYGTYLSKAQVTDLQAAEYHTHCQSIVWGGRYMDKVWYLAPSEWVCYVTRKFDLGGWKNTSTTR